MNKKLNFLNRLLAVCLIAVMLVLQTVPALAVDDGEPDTTPEITATEPQDSPTPTGDDGEGNDTPTPEGPSEGPETPVEPVTVSTLEELLQAIEQAESGAVIGIGGEIVCPAAVIIGDASKPVTIKRTAPEGHISIYSPDGDGSSAFQSITLDGNGIDAASAFVQVSISTSFSECGFINCTAGAVEVNNGDQYFGYCTFENNAAQYGAHIRINSGSANISNCVLSGGTATIRGGAIASYTDQKVNIENCSIFGNVAIQRGGGIWNKGEMTISQSMIHDNKAPWEPDDIVNEYQGKLALMDNHNALVALYAPYGLIPNKWAVDTFTDDKSNDPSMVFAMTFADNEPEPAPEPTPDPEPTPEPTPDPEPAPTPSQPSTSHSSGHSTPKPVTPKEITLTNGKAVLKAPEGVFWTGYETGHGGASEAVTRADLAALMVSLMDADNLKAYSTETAPFDDVEPGTPSATAIGTASNARIMLGCGLGAFRPDHGLTWGELITVLARFTDEEPPAEIYTGDHWAKDSINTAIGLGWIEYTEAFDPGGPVTCGEMVDLIQTVFQWATE